MKYGIQTCSNPDDPKSIYMRNMYHTFFWGPFKSEEDVSEAIKKLDKEYPNWDYEPFCIIYGANPLPEDYVLGFKSVSDETRKKIIGDSRS